MSSHSTGYDGQFYHYVAHDPLYRGEIGRAIPDPAIRYRRILLPALAWIAVAGSQGWIDCGYIACNLFFLGFGAWCLSRWLLRQKVNPGLSVLYVFVPAALIALDRLTVDLAFTSLCMAFVLYSRERSDGKLYATLVLATLCRDTGIALVAACTIEQWVSRRFRRGVWFATAIVPAAAWSLFVNLHMPAGPRIDRLALVPFRGLWLIFLDPAHYDLPPAARAAATALDYLELFGILLAVALAIHNVRRRGFGPMEGAAVLWAAIAVCLPQIFWADCYSAARVFTPLILFEALGWFSGDGAIAFAPLLLVAPRVWLQLGPQVLGIARSIL